MSHTPGPWEITGAPTIGAKGTWAVGSKPTGDWGISDHVAEVVREENANLIAAAPELLESLKLIVFMLTDFRYKAAEEQARAAIAKAEGKKARR